MRNSKESCYAFFVLCSGLTAAVVRYPVYFGLPVRVLTDRTAVKYYRGCF